MLTIVNLVFQFIYFMITLRIILSFFPNPINPSIYRLIYQTTEPILAPFRFVMDRFMPKGPGYYIDFSPLLAMFFLNLLRGTIIRILSEILW